MVIKKNVKPEFVDLIGMDENEEEKKAIEIIKFLQHKCIQENGIGMMTIYRVDEIANAIETILTLIEKQQKEVEELNKKIQRIYDTQRMIDISDINKSHISFN